MSEKRVNAAGKAPAAKGRGGGRGGKREDKSEKVNQEEDEADPEVLQADLEAKQAAASAAAEEERKRAEEEKAKKLAEERESRRRFISEIRDRIAEANKATQQRLEFRQSNIDAAKTRLDINFKSLDSSIKKNEAMIKKLRMISAENKDSILKGIPEINMTKFVSESVDAVADAKLKNSDVPAAVQIISLLHLRYSDFSRLLIPKIAQSFAPPRKELIASETEAERKDRLGRRRVSLRLLSELLIAGNATEIAIYSMDRLLFSYFLRELVYAFYHMQQMCFALECDETCAPHATRV